MSSQPRHREVIEQRRQRVNLLLAQNKTEGEIAQIIGVSRVTVARDVAQIRRAVVGWVGGLAKEAFIFEYKLSLDRLRTRIGVLQERFEKSDDYSERLAIDRELRADDKLYLELLGNIPTLQSLRNIVDRIDPQAA